MQELHNHAEEEKMTYISSLERFAMEKGLAKGLAEGQRQEMLAVIAVLLPKRFGEEGTQLLPAINTFTDLDQLRSIRQALLLDQSLEEVRKLLPGQ
jgi:hypothetical protein